MVQVLNSSFATEKIEALSPNNTGPLWQGPCADGDLGGVTQSMLGGYLGCRERFRVKYVLGLHPVDTWTKSLGYGSMWHVCEEELAKHVPDASGSHIIRALTALDNYTRQQMTKYPFQREEIVKWWNVCRVQFPEYVRYWSACPDVIDRRPLMQEQVFDVPYQLPSGRTVRLRGKFDSVDLIPSHGGIYLQENKTKSDVDPVALQRQLKFDLQTQVYLIALNEVMERPEWEACKRYNDLVVGVRYNVIRRELTIRKHKEKVVKPRISTSKKTPGKVLDPGKVVPAETDEEFYERYRREYIEADPAYFFFRVMSRVFPQDIAAFRTQFLDPCLENLCDDYEWWANCHIYGWDHWDYGLRHQKYPHHGQRHYRQPFGTYNSLNEGGSTDYDAYLEDGNEAGLRRADTLFNELV